MNQKESIIVPEYQRIVSYLYEYNHGIKGANVGFAKIEKRGDQLKLDFHIKTNAKSLDYKIYFYRFRHGVMEGIHLDTIAKAEPILEFKRSYPLTIEPNDVDGFLIYYSDDYFFGSQWKDHPIHIRSFSPLDLSKETATDNNPVEEAPYEELPMEEPAKEESNEEESNEKEPAEESVASTPEEKPEVTSKLVEYIEALQLEKEAKEQKTLESQEVFEWKEYPSLPLPSDYGFDSCIKIQLEDLTKVDGLPTNIATNGFLLLNYGNYGHLLLGKVPKTNQLILGVPGVFDNEKAFISKLFGFNTFVTVPSAPYKTGNFGYFILLA